MTDPTDNGIDAVQRRTQAMQRAIERFREIQQARDTASDKPFQPFNSDVARNVVPLPVTGKRSS